MTNTGNNTHSTGCTHGAPGLSTAFGEGMGER